MVVKLLAMNITNTITTKEKKSYILTDKEVAFIDEYMLNGNATQAVIKAGYSTRAPGTYASTLLCKEKITQEIQRRIAEREDAQIAKPAEILRFYTSVMRGEVLDQFGLEASLDTRIKSANELAKHQIELPLKLEQRNNTNNIGAINLVFQYGNEEKSPEFTDVEE